MQLCHIIYVAWSMDKHQEKGHFLDIYIWSIFSKNETWPSENQMPRPEEWTFSSWTLKGLAGISNKVHFGMLMSIFTLEIQFYQIFHHRGTHNISPFSWGTTSKGTDWGRSIISPKWKGFIWIRKLDLVESSVKFFTIKPSIFLSWTLTTFAP